MTYQRIGVCSLCNGDVLTYAGPWAGVGPAPGPKCGSCGARPARGPVIPMERPRESHGGYVAPLEWEVQIPAVVPLVQVDEVGNAYCTVWMRREVDDAGERSESVDEPAEGVPRR